MSKTRFLTLAGMILSASLIRLLPHPWNVTPVAALSLFAGVHFKEKWQAFLVPIAALLLSDLFLGFYAFWPLVYLAHLSVVTVGLFLRHHRTVQSLVAGSLLGSVSFFLISNLAHFFSSGMYPQTWSGLALCYTAALPFFRNSLLGDLFYVGLMFGAFRLAEMKFPILQETQPLASS